MAEKTNKYRVLCVDDEQKNLELLDAILSPLGYEMILVENGPAALEAVVDQKPDIILLDIMMPRMSGLEVLRKLRAEKAFMSIPVVILTSLQGVENRVEALDAGCDEFISKPFDKIELLATVKSLLRIKLYHDEIEKSYAQLKEAERLKKALVHMIIHDQRNCISGIASGAQLIRALLKENAKASELEEITLDIQTGIINLMGIITDVLDVNKLEEGAMVFKIVKFDLCQMVSEIVEGIRGAPDAADRKLTLGTPGTMPFIAADKGLIRRVVADLIRNALQAVPAGGTVDVDVSYGQENSDFCVRVKDSGRGIPQGYLTRIFDKFIQVETQDAKVRKGSGLGLAFCKLVVEAQGGKIWAESGPEQGSTFTVVLPVQGAVADI